MSLKSFLSRTFAKSSPDFQRRLNEKLIAAAVPGDPALVWENMTQLIERGANINAWDKDTDGPLFCRVCAHGLDVIAGKMLNAGVDLETQSYNQSTPFLLAAGAGQAKVMTLLANKGADLQATQEDGMDALDLLLQGIETHKDAKPRFREAYEFLVARGGRELDEFRRKNIFNSQPELAFLDPVLEGECLLQQAAAKGDTDGVRQQLDAGIKPDSAGKYGANRALYDAIEQGNAEMVEALLKAGANVQRGFARDSSKPIELAAKRGSLEVFKILLDFGADPTKPMILRHLNGGTTEIPLADSALTHKHPEMAAFIAETVKTWADRLPDVSIRHKLGIGAPLTLVKGAAPANNGLMNPIRFKQPSP